MNKKTKTEKPVSHFDFPRETSLLSIKFKKIAQDKSTNKKPEILPYYFFEKFPDKIPKNKCILRFGDNINYRNILSPPHFLSSTSKKNSVALLFQIVAH